MPHTLENRQFRPKLSMYTLKRATWLQVNERQTQATTASQTEQGNGKGKEQRRQPGIQAVLDPDLASEPPNMAEKSTCAQTTREHSGSRRNGPDRSVLLCNL